MSALPDAGEPTALVLARLRSLGELDLPAHGGQVFSCVQDSGVPGLDQLATAAYGLGAATDLLDPNAYPSTVALENEVVGAVAAVLGGDPAGGPPAAGTVTAGHAEACLLAVLAARDGLARDGTAHSGQPTIVLARTAHPMFHRAGQLFGVRPVIVEVDPATLTPDPAAIAAAIDEHTVLVVASAPTYPHGALDPVEAIAAAAAGRGVPCHVDAGAAGWLLPYLRRLGNPVPPFDLGVPGVTSIAVDLARFAYCPKGISVLLYADPGHRLDHYYAYSRWPGHTMVTRTLATQRSGGPLAGAWAVLRHIGDDGYLRLAEAVADAVLTIRRGIDRIGGLRVLGDPAGGVLPIALAPDADFDLFTMNDELRLRGWYATPQFGAPLSPCLDLTVTAGTRGREEPFLAALRASVAAARAAGPLPAPPRGAGTARTGPAGARPAATTTGSTTTGSTDIGVAGTEVTAALSRFGARRADPPALTAVGDPEQRAADPAGGADPPTQDGPRRRHPRMPARLAHFNTMLFHTDPRVRERLLINALARLHTRP